MHNTKTGEDIIFQYGQRVLEAISATFLNKDNQSKADRVADKEIFQAVGETILNFPLPPCDDLVPKQSDTIDREEQAEVDALVDLIMDEPGIEIECSNFPHCKCDKEKVRCVNYMGLAKKIIDRQKNKLEQTAGEGKDEEIKLLREVLKELLDAAKLFFPKNVAVDIPDHMTAYNAYHKAKEALSPS